LKVIAQIPRAAEEDINPFCHYDSIKVLKSLFHLNLPNCHNAANRVLHVLQSAQDPAPQKFPMLKGLPHPLRRNGENLESWASAVASSMV
jgi:hypothetical protein